MKIALISDIHGNIPALEAVFHSINNQNISKIYNLGDSLYGPLWPEETAQFLIKNNIYSIKGNGDDDLINISNKNETLKYCFETLSEKSIEWIKSLENYYNDNTITLFHGCPKNNREYFFEEIIDGNIVIKENVNILKMVEGIETNIIAFGHSHLERIIKIDKKIFINAGSVGLPAYSEDEPKHKMETYNNYSKYIIVDGNDIEIKYIEYDYKSSAKRARENNRNDWSKYIIFGRVKE